MKSINFVLKCVFCMLFISSVVIAHDEPHTYEAVDLSEASNRAQTDVDQRMQDLLHWAIEHSNPDALHEEAEKIRTQELVGELLEQKRQRVLELYQYMKNQPTETEVMQEVISMLTTGNMTEDEDLQTLELLQALVEPIDNANNLKVMGGLPPLLERLQVGSSRIQAVAAHVLGTAASNNAKFQEHLMEHEPRVLEMLMLVATSNTEETSVKGVYALANMVRNEAIIRQQFLKAGGLSTLQRLLSGMHTRAKRKAVNLVVDLIQADDAFADHSLYQGLPDAVLSLLVEEDLDFNDKGLLALQVLLRRQGADRVFREKGAGPVLRNLKGSLKAVVPEDSDEHEFVAHLVNSCQEMLDLVEARKLEL